MKRLVVLASLTTLAVSVAACSGSPTLGQPTAAPSSPGSGGGQDTSPVSPSSATGPRGLPVNQPCSLLSASQVAQLGVSTQPTQENVGIEPTCEMDNGDDNISVGILTSAGIADLTPAKTGGPLRNTTVGSHQARQSVSTNTGSCLISIAVSAKSRVDVVTTGNGDTDPCPLAERVAKLVEPSLP